MKYKNKMREKRRGRNRRGVRKEDKGGSEREKYGLDGEE